MKVVHALFVDESGCIYCKKFNAIIQLVEMRTPCLQCEKWRGTIQGEGCECEWDDFDFKCAVSVYDHIAEYDRVNSFKTIPQQEKLKIWQEKNEAQRGNTSFGDGGNFMPIDYADTILEDYNPCPVSVMFAKSKEQAHREGSGRCIYPEFPDSRRVYSAMANLDDSLCIVKTIGWEREICVRKADVSLIIELLYQDSVTSWDYMTIINQIDGDFVWIIGYGD